jgi:PAS domain S-box-containing protein
MKKLLSLLFLRQTDGIEDSKILTFTRVIILTTIAVFSILSIVKIVVPPPINSSDYVSWMLIGVLSVYFLVLKSGRVSLAGSLYVITMYLALTYLAWSYDGVKDSAVVAYFVLIQIAIYMRWTWLALSISLLSLVSVWSLYYAEYKEIIVTNKDTILNYSIDLSVILIIGITLVYLNYKSSLFYFKRLQKELDDRVRAEEKAKASEENFHVLFDENPLPTVLSEIPSGKIAFVNKRFAALMKMKPEDIIGKIAADLGLLSDPKDQEKLTKMITNQGFIDNLEVPKNFIDGTKGTDLIFMRIVTIDNKLYCLTVVHDITKRKQVEELLQEKNKEIEVQNEEYQQLNEELVQTNAELLEARDRAEESDRLKSAFLTNMSHEIRTPMNGILGFSELLKDPGISGEDQQEYIGIIEKSSARLLNIINNLVDISKIESGQMELSVSETNVNEQIEHIYAYFKREAEQKGLKILVRKQLPSIEAVIKTDKKKINAILSNLVRNAIKYTDNGTIEIGYNKIPAGSQTAVNKEAQCIASLRFFVRDTGIGIPEERKEAIFDRFVQADIEDRMAFQGAGLGLSISKAYVEMLGGKIWVESEEGNGSTFYFSIPYLNIVDENYFSKDVISVVEGENQLNNLKILIVEDDQVSEMVITRIVRTISNEILNVRTGIDAVATCRNNPDIDLILMDIKMPGIDGYEATRQIRQFNQKVIIIAQTAFALIGDKQKALNAGCNDYITKPTRKELLLAMIRKQLAQAN